MKKLLLVKLFILSVAVSFASDSTYVINGKFNKYKKGRIFLTIFSGNTTRKDSAVIKSGKFNFKGFIKEPSFASLTYRGKSNDNFIFYIEPITVSISGEGDSLKLLSIKGSSLNEEDKLLKQRLEYISKWEDNNGKIFEQAFKKKNKVIMDSLDEVDNLILLEKRKVVAQFVTDYPHSIRSVMAISDNYAYYAEATDVEPVFNLLDPSLRSSPKGLEVQKMIDVFKTVAVGRLAPDFQQTDQGGKLISLSSIKGKYLLVDFWASWCGPCRRENPNVVKLYQQYKDKGFEILGVSYDAKKDRWEKAIIDDKLEWKQVSDLKGWKNATSELYGIKAIPSNLLIDKEGRIIAKNLFGKKLADKLQQLIM